MVLEIGIVEGVGKLLNWRVLERDGVVPRVVVWKRKNALEERIVVFDVHRLGRNTGLFLRRQLSQKLLFWGELFLALEFEAVFGGLVVRVVDLGV